MAISYQKQVLNIPNNMWGQRHGQVCQTKKKRLMILFCWFLLVKINSGFPFISAINKTKAVLNPLTSLLCYTVFTLIKFSCLIGSCIDMKDVMSWAYQRKGVRKVSIWIISLWFVIRLRKIVFYFLLLLFVTTWQVLLTPDHNWPIFS